jgi:molybdate transport system regulatory protein
MDMSYRRAWLLIDELNGLFGKPVVETTAGGTGGGGARVTAFGMRVVAAFRDMEKQANDLAKASMAKLK